MGKAKDEGVTSYTKVTVDLFSPMTVYAVNFAHY